jgi:hypothetical protein
MSWISGAIGAVTGGGLLPGLPGIGGGGGGGPGQSGIGNDQQTTNASQDDHSVTLGNNAFMNTGTYVTDAGATSAALTANVQAVDTALNAIADIAGKAIGATASAGSASGGGLYSAPAAANGGGLAIDKNTGLILAVIAAVAAILFFRKK